ncbi:MAG: response regulator [Patescibacteria group bacterium]|uniref:Response regulator n=1 Tax=candidate division WWE3 bacterium TaxID=2053526 RepID=A0A955ECC9_UNCKA|nr:response regulator [candidate division WWE3 bacterium]
MSHKVLVIDDEVSLLSALEKHLTTVGFTVITASDARVGLELFAKESPNLIILDLLMPEMSGIDFLREFKGNQKNPTPVIVLSNLSEYNEIKTALDLGAVVFLVKSDNSLQEIESKIRELLVAVF